MKLRWLPTETLLMIFLKNEGTSTWKIYHFNGDDGDKIIFILKLDGYTKQSNTDDFP